MFSSLHHFHFLEIFVPWSIHTTYMMINSQNEEKFGKKEQNMFSVPSTDCRFR